MDQLEPQHPGPFIRASVLPPDLTVTAAAKLLGVGRPALSNLLNGNASLSSDMAARLAKAFGADDAKLLQMQAAYDRAEAKLREPEIAVRAYAPNILAIRAEQIDAWAELAPARNELAALLRRLVVSTASGVTEIDFPAHENAQRHGWDGFVRAEAATPWVPLGASGWEFGVNQDPRQKAEHDYSARTRDVPVEARASLTFVFVTPRNWPGKTAWVEAKRAEKTWKGIRAYDASDLEQWIETSVPAQAWFAERLPLGSKDILDLDACWRRWAQAAKPVLSKALFKATAAFASKKLAPWLEILPDQPFTVVADSDDEALAALACAFDEDALAQGHARERVVVVRSAGALAKLAGAASGLTVVLAAPEAEIAAAGLHRQHHTVVVTHRNAVAGEPNLSVDLVDDETFRTGLEDMGVGRDDIERLDRESGRSLTVLRRRLAQLPALKSPPWAGEAAGAACLIPLMLVGAWDANSEADQAVLAALADRPHADIEKTVAAFVGGADSPLWSIGSMRGVVSKTDAFYALRRLVTKEDLRRFFGIARVVLSEEDPALELQPDKQWAANVFGKSRRHSGALRRGLCETLVLLSVHGDNLFKGRLGYDVVGQVNNLVREMLTPLDGATWQSQRNDLRHYAEAAPGVFLDLLDDDLRSGAPKVHALLQPAPAGGFSFPGRTDLLWALETLAWNPVWLSRVVVILAKLAEVKISDNWANKPEKSLAAIFRCWMPQTAATIEQRIDALDLLVHRSPSIAWRICLDQFSYHGFGDYSAKPRWRVVPAGAGEPVSGQEAYRMARHAADVAIAWPHHDEITLGDLVEQLDGIPDDEGAVWAAVGVWLKTGPTDEAKASLKSRIQHAIAIRRLRSKEGDAALPPPEAVRLLEALEPHDLIWRHKWLFAQHWIHEWPGETEEDTRDYAARESRIEQRRIEVLTEIWREMGFDGVQRLCAQSEAPEVIGAHLAKVLSAAEAVSFAYTVAERAPEVRLDACLFGLLWSVPVETRDRIFAVAAGVPLGKAGVGAEVMDRMLQLAPFGAETWARLESLGDDQLIRYWSNVTPRRLFRDQPEEVNRVVDELLRVARPRAAFNAVSMVFALLTSDRLLRLLNDTATVNAEPPGRYELSAHDISEAFEVLTKREDVEVEAVARLEFLFIEGLSHTKHGISNLERVLATSPALFVQVLAYAFKRRDGGEDPPELKPKNAEVAGGLARSAYALLTRAKRIPGFNDKGEFDERKLREWVVAARSLARDYGRQEVGDSMIGQLLAHSPEGRDGIWPMEAIRNVLEDLGTSKMADGLHVGRTNARGAVWHGEGGDQERALAKTYRDWCARIAARYPFTGRLLESIAADYDHRAAWHDDRSTISKRLGD